jgi:hypothetical protein
MDEQARSNLDLMLKVVVRRLRQLRTKAKEATRVAESPLGRRA